jgi:hypothetical protein
VLVSGARCFDLARSRDGRIAQTRPVPAKKPFTSKLDDHKIDQEVSVAVIAIGERMDLHQAVLQAHRNLIRLIRLVFDPCLGIVEQLAQRYWNLKVVNPDVALAGSEFPAHRHTSWILKRILSQLPLTSVKR